ncbi:A/G-specific adenine glycosylase [Flavobacterium sp. GSP27]|uniref:A/G-specific adenine glycosylase n=1 Tax=unclassified Flavobacterium TaxID=196869 RepID=UPI000F846441|nr:MULTISPECIES: A/G-specific adenine glycosylase [unclassified Flavobacterium]RTY94419.1 A/G-specific adenine glycosylase [Flavobacterium sp. GSN2]RTY70561.1 A/G-specific adenine glycosylase [Flavobacterium sp. LB2P53]RTY82664.1 A/G-specific adenine glycosylase [Flavobacterium sp. ZB4P23]RTY89905.1 A/G-specific adenine glycosylase [Flavobacterium sp. RSP46]RTZ10167.1 A/G-specific adenine glycosylase [Flavobacterium sp. GSP27]
MNFSNLLIKWYLQNKRDLPWRNTTDPYPIWLSEIMLQQTRVAQGMPYFMSFTAAFPTVFDLAKANEEHVLKLWQGLGYYSRARNLHKTAQYVASDLGGSFPDNYADLLKLKGIGEYTAAAIASFSYNEAVPVVDGNVFRVLSRYFDIDTDIAQASAKKEFAALAFELMPKDNPATFNQAIMEFGALQCVPKSPNCGICVFNESCAALQKNKVNQLPVKTKKLKVRSRYFNYLVVADENDNTIIQKRTDKGIWHNLYEFPLIETEKEEDFDCVSEAIQADYFKENTVVSMLEYNEKSILHKLSHQHLHIKFWKVKIEGTIENGIDVETLRTFPFPIVIHNFIEKDL